MGQRLRKGALFFSKYSYGRQRLRATLICKLRVATETASQYEPNGSNKLCVCIAQGSKLCIFLHISNHTRHELPIYINKDG